MGEEPDQDQGSLLMFRENLSSQNVWQDVQRRELQIINVSFTKCLARCSSKCLQDVHWRVVNFRCSLTG